METRIGSHKSKTQDFACNWHSTHKIRPTQQARSLDGDEIRSSDESSSDFVVVECCDVRIAHGFGANSRERGYLHG